MTDLLVPTLDDDSNIRHLRNKTVLYGMVDLKEKSKNGFKFRVVMPAKNAFTTPDAVVLYSKRERYQEGQMIEDLACLIQGRRTQNTNKETGEIYKGANTYVVPEDEVTT